jgi:predicted PurR-regulated permease PerM/methylmalonyl-CoA mutase cobalamin-binding subunit
MPRERRFSPLFMLVATIAVITALHVAQAILLPIALAVLLSFLLTPVANRLESFHVPRIPAVILVVLLAFLVLGALGWIVTDQLVALRYELPNHRTKIVAKVRALKDITQRFQQVGEEITNGADEAEKADAGKQKTKGDEKAKATDEQGAQKDGAEQTDEAAMPPSAEPPSGEANQPDAAAQARQILKQGLETGDPAFVPDSAEAVPVKVVEMPPSPLTQAQAWLGPLMAPLTGAGMVVVLLFFMLLDRENQRNRLIQLFGTQNLHTTTEALHDATRRVGRYLRMQFMINAGYGVAVAIGLYFIGVPSAIMWGVLGFALRFLPYLGPWLSAVLPILVSLAVSDGWTQPIMVMCMYVVYELVLNNVAEPMLYGSSTGVSTVGVIISAIFWTWMWGPVGLILAMPMTVCLVVVARYVPQLRFITVLLADQPPLSPAERLYQRLLAFDDSEALKLARKHLKSSSLAQFYDEVLIPALNLAEADRHADLLNEDQESFVREAAHELVEELGEEHLAAEAADEGNGAAKESGAGDRPVEETGRGARIFCIPLRDDADETTCRMLAQLLRAEGFDVDTGSAGSLTSEMVESVAATDSDLVVISVLPPIRPRDSRLLWKRLRHRYPTLPIVVGYWLGPNATESLLPPAGDESSKVATTLAEAVALVRSEAAQRELAKAM